MERWKQSYLLTGLHKLFLKLKTQQFSVKPISLANEGHSNVSDNPHSDIIRLEKSTKESAPEKGCLNFIEAQEED